jgi:hypothetical protein
MEIKKGDSVEISFSENESKIVTVNEVSDVHIELTVDGKSIKISKI